MSARNPTLARAFMRWLPGEGRGLQAEISVYQHRHRIDIRFRRLPELQGSIRKNLISVAAIRRGACWDFVFDRDVVPVQTAQGWYCRECPQDNRQLFASREQLWIDHLFIPFRDWVLGPLQQMNCVEFIRYGGVTSARLQPDPHVPDWIIRTKERYWKRRDELERTATRDELAVLDREHAQLIDAMWAEARTPVDDDQLEREALASLGPDGIAYLNSLTDDDFQPFDMDELRRGHGIRKE